MTTATSTTEFAQIKNIVEKEQASARATLDKFAERLNTNPVYAFEWGDPAYEAAAANEGLARLQNLVALVEEERLPLDELLPAMDKQVKDWLVRRLSGSTSPSHNLMQQAKGAFAAEWLDESGFSLRTRIRYFIRKIASENEDGSPVEGGCAHCGRSLPDSGFHPACEEAMEAAAA